MENNGKMWTSEEPIKIYFVRKVLSKNVTFNEFEPKLWALMSNYHDHSPNKVMSRDPGSKIRKFLCFCLIL